MPAERPERKRNLMLLALLAGLLAVWLLGGRGPAAPEAAPAIAAAEPSGEEVPRVLAPLDRPPAPPQPEKRSAEQPLASVAAAPAPASAAAPNPHPFGFCDPPGSPPATSPALVSRLPPAAARDFHAGRAALLQHRPAEAAAAFQRALASAPESDVVALELGALLANTTRIAEARELYAGYLRRHPEDRIISQRAARLDTQQEIQGGFTTAESGGVTVWYPREALSDAHALRTAADVRRALDEAAALTGTPRREALTVVVYPGRSELLASSCVPAWSGGLYDGALRLVAVDGAIPRPVLRHESLHAQVVPEVRGQPRWFDEGLAQWFADPDHPSSPGPLRLLAQNQTAIPFASLSGSFYVFEAGEDAHLAYAQSEAMVRWLVATRGTRSIADAVTWFNRGGSSGGLLRALDPSGELDEAAFAAWLRAQRW